MLSSASISIQEKFIWNALISPSRQLRFNWLRPISILILHLRMFRVKMKINTPWLYTPTNQQSFFAFNLLTCYFAISDLILCYRLCSNNDLWINNKHYFFFNFQLLSILSLNFILKLNVKCEVSRKQNVNFVISQKSSFLITTSSSWLQR